jgi:hypothetical protein
MMIPLLKMINIFLKHRIKTKLLKKLVNLKLHKVTLLNVTYKKLKPFRNNVESKLKIMHLMVIKN